MTDPAASGGAITPPAPGPSSNRGLMIVLAYLWLLAFVPLFVERQDPEVQWHAKHGIVLMIAELIFWLTVAATTSVLALSTVAAGIAMSVLAGLAWLGLLTLHFAAILRAINGGRLLIPGLSGYASRL